MPLAELSIHQKEKNIYNNLDILNININKKTMMLLFRLILNTGALLLLPYLISGIQVEGIYIAFITAIILGLINISIRPLVKLLTLPISILTLGLFALVINAVFFWFVASFIDGFTVTGFWPAFFGALIMSVVSWLTNQLLKS
jgi:putative membrane protein